MGVIILLGVSVSFYFGLTQNCFGCHGNRYCFDEINEDIMEEMYNLMHPPSCQGEELCSPYEPVKADINLPRYLLRLNGGEECGVAMAIQNTLDETKEFTYDISFGDPDLNLRCGPELEKMSDDIFLDKGGTVSIAAGETYYFISRMKAHEGPPLCTTRVLLSVYVDGEFYAVAHPMDIQFNDIS